MDISKIDSAITNYNKSIPTSNSSDEVEHTIDNESTEASISYDKGADVFVVKFIDQNTKKVVQQFPIEAMIEFAKTLNKSSGNIIDIKV